jgi:hypothetical protein
MMPELYCLVTNGAADRAVVPWRWLVGTIRQCDADLRRKSKLANRLPAAREGRAAAAPIGAAAEGEQAMKRRSWLGFAVAFFAVAAIAAGKPLAISLAPGVATITEGGGINFTLAKSGGNGKPAPAKITATGISCPASAVPGSSFVCMVPDDAIVNGTRSATVLVTASTGATARATVTILDNDVAPPPPPPPATETCPDGSVIPATSTCPPAPPPPPGPGTTWVPAPLQVGGYAWLKNQGPCCNGLIVRIVDGGMTADADPAVRQHWWATVYYADPSGNFPASNPYWQTAWLYGYDDGLEGIAPSPN